MKQLDLLEGVRVLEVGRFVAVPFAGRLLADLGATVERVSEADADPDARRLPPGAVRSLDDFLSRGKARVSPALLAERARDADLVLADIRALPADFAPQSTLISILRMGADGAAPLADSALLCARAGVSWAIGEPGRPPLAMPAHSADHLVGAVFAGASLALLLAGAEGRHEIDALVALSAFVEQNSTSYRESGIGWRREGRRAPGSAGIYPYGLLPCADGQIVMLGRSTRDWQAISDGIGAHDVFERFPDPFEIAREHADEVDALLAPYLARLSKADVLSLAETTGVLAAPVAEIDEVAARDHLATERDFWHDIDGVRVPGLPFVVHD